MYFFMALINITNVLQNALKSIEKASYPGGVALLSYKRNRRIILSKLDDTEVQLQEDGYLCETKTVRITLLPKILKAAIKREFPRSRKVRVYKFSSPEEFKNEYKKL